MLDPSPRAASLIDVMVDFLADEVYSAESTYESQVHGLGEIRATPPVLEDLKKKARERGLWNLFLPHAQPGHDPMTNLDYARFASVTSPEPHGVTAHLLPRG